MEMRTNRGKARLFNSSLAGICCLLILLACKPTPSDISTLASKGDEAQILIILDRLDDQFAPPDRAAILNACIEAGFIPSFRMLRQRIQSQHLKSKLPSDSERLMLVGFAKISQQTEFPQEYLRLYFENGEFSTRDEAPKFIKAVISPKEIDAYYIQTFETRIKAREYSQLLRLTLAYSNVSARPITSVNYERVQALVTRSEEFTTASKELAEGEGEYTEIRSKVSQAKERIHEIQGNEPKGTRVVARVLNIIRPPIGYEIALENGLHAVLYSFRPLQYQGLYSFLVSRLGDEAIELRPELGGGIVNMPKLIEVEKTDWIKMLDEAKRDYSNQSNQANATSRMVKFREARVSESRLAFLKALDESTEFIKEFRGFL